MFKIATTRQEKLQVVKYWDEQRKIAAQIRDEYDKIVEDTFNQKFLDRCKISEEKEERPDFFEPL